ncbi:hypothetical protein [Streptomyces sp. G-G2]|uniref:hypothetical protein n=1 Tax=Streptomyces sp. G-G2 TaxID=3046201 RepID=UPI0024B8EEAE|nr:hypothetical protein [Streptomyces sp. G-G2]MDJ0381110.1 hypothetical protein [Streptomyces sp. G-G2]
MVGTLTTAVGRKAFSYWPGAAAVHLLPGGQAATDVNDSGHAVGSRYDAVAGRTIGLEWSGGALRRELALPTGFQLDAVTGINSSGQITGHGSGLGDDPDDSYGTSPGLLGSAHPAVAPLTLQPPGGDYESYKTLGIENKGRVVGYYAYSRAMEDTAVSWSAPYGSPT